MTKILRRTSVLLQTLALAYFVARVADVQAAEFAGKHLAAGGKAIVSGASLEFALTVQNTGTSPWLFSDDFPGWVYGVWFEDCSWYDPDAEYWTDEGYFWTSVGSGATATGTGSLSADKLPSQPGAYSFWVYAYYPDDLSGDYLMMAGSPKKVSFTILAAPPSQKWAAHVGVAFSKPVPEEFTAQTKLTVKGLPAGLKFNAATRSIEGVPTKAGWFYPVVSVPGGLAQTLEIAVGALPTWAQGTFSGDIWMTTNGFVGGTATMTVSALGRVTGKLAFGGKNYAFSAPSLTYGDDFSFGVETSVKIGTAATSLWLDIAPLEIPYDAGFAGETLSDVYGKLNGEQYGTYMLRHVWKELGAGSIAPYIGYYTATLPGNDAYGSGYLTFTVDKAGKVKTSGKLADGTAVSQSGTLLLDDLGDAGTVLYLAPSAYKGGCLYGWVWFLNDGTGKIVTLNSGFYEDAEGELAEWGFPIAWSTFNPLATEEYGAGFYRALDINGGTYDKLINLQAHYQDGLTVGAISGLPQMQVWTKVTDYDPDSESATPPVVWWWQDALVGPAPFLPNGLLLTPNAAGTLFTVPKSPAPTQTTDPATGVPTYNYAALANPSGMTFSLNRATGIFKGGFNVFYDYVSASNHLTEAVTWTHYIKKLPYEGILTPVREAGWGIGEGNGFFLWSETGWYDSGKDDSNGDPVYNSYPFLWSYNLMLLGE